MLLSKSVQKKLTKSDGIRVCIMRRPDPGIEYDIWLPVLSPSGKLLTDYHEKKVTWDQFEKLFTSQVLKKQKKFLKLLIEISKNRRVTILCWEDEPAQCHRRLVLNACRQIDPTLRTKLA